ncbi:MAG: hypothetical protein ACRCZF_08620, partial [Gemmataceae bacterium]
MSTLFFVWAFAFQRAIELQRGDMPVESNPAGNSKNRRMGIFDMNGNFTPYIGTYLRSRHFNFTGVGYDIYLINKTYPRGFCECYERRTNAVIEGKYGTLTDGRVFIPTEGSVVQRFQDLLKRERVDRLIYNYTERTLYDPPKNLKADAFVDYVLQSPKPSAPPAGYRFLTYQEFDAMIEVPHDKRTVVRVMGSVCEFGVLERTGEFLPDYSLPVMEYAPPSSPSAFTIDTFRFWAPPKNKERIRNFGDEPYYPNYTYTLPLYGEKSEPCYEYRSGRLIKGILHNTGNFAPE